MALSDILTSHQWFHWPSASDQSSTARLQSLCYHLQSVSMRIQCGFVWLADSCTLFVHTIPDKYLLLAHCIFAICSNKFIVNFCWIFDIDMQKFNYMLHICLSIILWCQSYFDYCKKRSIPTVSLCLVFSFNSSQLMHTIPYLSDAPNIHKC